MQRFLLAAVIILVGSRAREAAADMAYGNVGTVAPTTYLKGSGTEIFGYFAGSTAGFSEQVGMYVNGVLSPAGFVFPNHSTATGTKVDFGFAAAGSDIVFAVQVFDYVLGNNPTGTASSPYPHYTGTPSYILYSAPLDAGVGPNGAYTFANSDATNHAYIAPYTSGAIGGINVSGTYVAFEDTLTNGASGFASDLNYHDEQFVFQGVAPSVTPAAGAVPEPSSLTLMGLGVATVWLVARRRRRA